MASQRHVYIEEKTMTEKLIQFTLKMVNGRTGVVRVSPELAGETYEQIVADEAVAEIDIVEIEVAA